MRPAIGLAARRAAVVIALLGLAPAGPAAADWLILKGGERLETRGPWEVRGRLVVFTDAQGRLSSLRADEVDLEASAAYEPDQDGAAAAAAPAEPEAPRQAAFVLTDADVRRGPPAATEPAAADEPETPAAERLVVTDWQEGQLPDGGGLTLSGVLRNRSGDATTAITLTALLYDREGTLLGSGEASLATNTLMPRRQTRFTVDFPGIYDMAAVRFTPTSLALEAGEPEGEALDEEGGLDETAEFPDEEPPLEP